MGLKRRKAGGNWHIDFKRNGHHIRESAHTTNRGQALKYLQRRIDEIESNVLANPNLKFERLLELVIEDYEANDLRSTDALKFSFAPLTAAFGGLRISDITTDRIERYKVDRLRDGAARATINLELFRLSRGFTLALGRDLILKKPAIKAFRVKNVRQGFVTKAEYEAMREHLPEWVHILTDWLFLTGMRIGAALQLEWRDYDGKFIHVRREIEKTDEPNDLPLEGRFREVIERALKIRNLRCPRIFQREGRPLAKRTIETLVPAASLAAGLRRITPHDFRRSAIKNMVDAGIDPQVAMRFSGHKTRRVFDHYRIVNHETMRRAILEKYDPYLDAQSGESHAVIRLDTHTKVAQNAGSK